MFDKNEFKRKAKLWMREHPRGSEQDFQDFCEELVPPSQYAANQWLIDQTLAWYKHIMDLRKREQAFAEEEESY